MKKLFTMLLLLLTVSVQAQWSTVFNHSTYAMCGSGSDLYMSNNDGVSNRGIYKSTDNGANWTKITTLQNIVAMDASGNKIYAAAGQYSSLDTLGLWYSTNNGVNWVQHTQFRYNGVSTFLTSVKVVGTRVYVTYGKQLWYSDNGSTFNSTTMLSETMNCIAANISGSAIYVGTGNQGSQKGYIYMSPNSGSSWIKIDSLNSPVNNITLDGAIIYATNYSLWKSTNNGGNWTEYKPNNSSVYSMTITGNYIFLGTNQGIYMSANGGTTWVLKNQGLPSSGTGYYLSTQGNYLFTSFGQANSLVYRRLLSETIDVRQISSVVTDYALEQNYPNPWNPATKIEYSIPKSGLVTLKVFDILGKEISTLVDENQSPGTYSVNFQGAELPSGIYFYRLQAGSYTETKQMILIK